MNYVLEGFYKQAEEMGMSRNTSAAFLDTIEKTAIALNEYVTEAAIASGDPVSFMQKFASELIEMEKTAAFSPMMDDRQKQQLQQAQQQANATPANQVNHGMLEDFAAKHPDIAPYIQKLLGGGAGNAGMGALGGGGIGALIASLTGSNPLMGLLLGGLGGGALGYFGDKFKGIGADTSADIATKQNNIAADTTKNLGAIQHAAAPAIMAGAPDVVPHMANHPTALGTSPFAITPFSGPDAGKTPKALQGKPLLEGGLKAPIAGPNAGTVASTTPPSPLKTEPNVPMPSMAAQPSASFTPDTQPIGEMNAKFNPATHTNNSLPTPPTLAGSPKWYQSTVHPGGGANTENKFDLNKVLSAPFKSDASGHASAPNSLFGVTPDKL